MKVQVKIYFLGMLLIYNAVFSQQKIVPYVDERVELMSSIFRMMGAEEYSDKNNALYVEDIEKYFSPFKESKFLSQLKKDRYDHGLGYDAVISMAVHLQMKNGKWSLVDPKPTFLDKRWKREKLPEFLKNLNEYYQKTKFHDFYKDHQKDYQQASKAFSDSVLVKLNQDWYPRFYGKSPNEDYKVVIGYGNGGGNYGPRVMQENKRDEVYAIVSGGTFDGRTMTYSSAYAPTLIHEFNHSFVNYVLENPIYERKLEQPATKILDAVRQPMKEQAYGDWKTLINESIVRAAVIVYMKENHFSDKAIKAEMKEQLKRSFVWTPELVELLEYYQKNRKEYPSLESFYPNIVSFFQLVAMDVDKMLGAYQAKLPKVKSVSPDINGRNDVDPNLKEMIIYFDRELVGNQMSINIGSLGREGVPIKSRPVFIDNNWAIKIELGMKPNTEYEFVLVGNKFESLDGYPLQNYIVRFKTK